LVQVGLQEQQATSVLTAVIHNLLLYLFLVAAEQAVVEFKSDTTQLTAVLVVAVNLIHQTALLEQERLAATMAAQDMLAASAEEAAVVEQEQQELQEHSVHLAQVESD
jgi:hypothetical protein